MEQGAPGVLSPRARDQEMRAGLRGSLYRTLLLLFLAFLFIPLVAFFVAVGYLSQRQAADQVSGQLNSVASLQKSQIDQWISERGRTMQILAGQPGLIDSARALLLAADPQSAEAVAARIDLHRRLDAAKQADPQYFVFLIANADSQVVFATSSEYDKLIVSQKEFFSEVLGRQREHVQLPGFDKSIVPGDPLLYGGQPFMAASAPILDEKGEFRGVLAGLIAARALDNILANIEGLSAGRAYLFDNDGRLLASSVTETLALTGSFAANQQIALVSKADPNTGEHPVVAGVRYGNFRSEDVFGHGEWYTYYTLKGVTPDDPRYGTSLTGLALFVEQPASVALAGVQQLQLILVGAALLGGLAMLLGGFLMARSVVRPVRALTETAVSIAGGNLDQTVDIRRTDEIGLLARAFNTMTGELRELYTDLEEKVAARTQDLERANTQVIRRALQLQTSTEVAQAATSILNTDRLLDRVVNLVRDRFGFYHVQVFLLSPDERWAVLRASTGEVGRQMLERKHRLEVGGHSLIGFVTAQRVAHVAMDVGSDEFHRFNPMLPETRAELAIPLKIGDRLLGALDVQSTDVDAFTSEDIALFESLAAQISVAIENARLFESTRHSVRRERTVKDLGDKIRGSLDIDQILETTARELNNALGASRTVVRVGTAPTPPAATRPGGTAAPAGGNGNAGEGSENPS